MYMNEGHDLNPPLLLLPAQQIRSFMSEYLAAVCIFGMFSEKKNKIFF